MALPHKGRTTQICLVEALAHSDYAVNQATVLRELRRVGPRKIGVYYQVPSAGGIGVPILSLAVTSAGCMVVLKTKPAFASVLAHKIDASSSIGVLGTIAGDDTVFVATNGEQGRKYLFVFLGLLQPDSQRRGAHPPFKKRFEGTTRGP